MHTETRTLLYISIACFFLGIFFFGMAGFAEDYGKALLLYGGVVFSTAFVMSFGIGLWNAVRFDGERSREAVASPDA